MPPNFTRYPVGLILSTTMYDYEILEQVCVDECLVGYRVKNLGTSRVYIVGSSKIHSKRFKIKDPVARVLYQDSKK